MGFTTGRVESVCGRLIYAMVRSGFSGLFYAELGCQLQIRCGNDSLIQSD